MTTAASASAPGKQRGRWRWLRRTFVGLLVLILGIALLATLATAWAIRRPFPVTSGVLVVGGLEQPVTVQRDAWGIPSVYASTSHDLFFGQGYVHAQDRFWEMDFRRHVTAGRLSEMFGDTTLDTDEFVRTMGWRRIAEQEVALLSPDTRGLLQAYADGVNAYVADRSPTDLSLEYSVLWLTNRGYTVEPWTPADSLAWLKAMSYDLSGNATTEIERVLVAAKVGAARAAQVFPDYPYDRHRPILGQGAWSGAGPDAVFDQNLPAPTSSPADTALALAQTRSALQDVGNQLATVRALLGLQGQHAGAGSNNWVVSGELTATGKPLLANDPHLAPSMPSIWTQMGLHCVPVSSACPYDVAGFTFSGFPGVIIGHNASIAWGFTNLGPDTQDLFLEKVEGDAVLVDGAARPMATRQEVIEVAGGEPVTIAV
ncbi:MAG TPA: penicillin acylase family protein, partial [Candidatus Limnocylindria bacterium]|nr:penicillin acylase family protein [Candidatus Limnocylindria bacterium]